MVNTLTLELLDAMIDSGMYQITLSLDGATEKALELHRKPVDLGRIEQLIEYIHKREVLVHGTLVVGTLEHPVKL